MGPGPVAPAIRFKRPEGVPFGVCYMSFMWGWGRQLRGSYFCTVHGRSTRHGDRRTRELRHRCRRVAFLVLGVAPMAESGDAALLEAVRPLAMSATWAARFGEHPHWASVELISKLRSNPGRI